MRFAIAAVALLVGIVSAQSTPELPQCATQCALSSVGSSNGCELTNAQCLCSSQGYLTAFASCTQSTCNATEIEAATQFGLNYCASAGVTITSSLSATSTATDAAQSSTAQSSASEAASSISSSASSSSSLSASSSIASESSASVSNAGASAGPKSAASSASGNAAPTQGAGMAWEMLGLGAAVGVALL